jgi:DNA-binding transcriptional MerR regulator
MSDNLQRLLFANDLKELGYIINEFIEIAKLLEDSREVAKLIGSLDRFYYAYESRVREVSELLGKIDKAREKHRMVIAQREDYKTEVERLTNILQRYESDL